MKILLTNDDGIYAEGIYEAYLQLSEIGDVYVVAPITEQSAVGHAITISDPLMMQECKKFGQYFGVGIKGTPADCVKLAIHEILDEKPDIVVSGINHGANVASNVIYSGTVSAATEGAMLGVRSIAVSLATKEKADFKAAAEYAAQFAKMLHESDLPEHTLLSINVPAIPKDEIKGWQYAVQGTSKYLDKFAKRVDPRGRTYFWMEGEKNEIHMSSADDDYIISQNYVSVTPLKFDMTDYDMYEKLKKMEGKSEHV